MINLGLRRIKELVYRLNNPLSNLKVFHVSGTNGKGSVCTYLESILSANLKVGKFTSPHLIAPNDAIRINNASLSVEEYKELTDMAKKVSLDYSIDATEFEVQTAVAFKAFQRHNIDIGVIEVGLGGLEDATNILNPSNVLCSIITKISLDHEHFLGTTLSSVAGHKAGIIKEGVPVVVDGTNSPEVLEVIKNTARSCNSKLITTAPTSSDFIEHNKAVAIEAVKYSYPSISESEISLGIERAIWPGRLQWIDTKTLVDGAHNVEAARMLRIYVDTLGLRPIRWITAFSKPPDALLEILIKPQDTVLATDFGNVEGMPWVQAHPIEQVANSAEKFTKNVSMLKDLKNIPEFEGITVICGSLYLVGCYLKYMNE